MAEMRHRFDRLSCVAQTTRAPLAVRLEGPSSRVLIGLIDAPSRVLSYQFR